MQVDKLNSPAAMQLLVVAVLLLTALTVCLAVLFRRRILRIRGQALIDPVTKGWNREGFRKAAEPLCAEAADRYAVVAVRIRNYRQVMQTFGCGQSDRMLRHIGGILKNQLSAAEPSCSAEDGSFCFLLKNRQEKQIEARLLRILTLVNQPGQKERVPYRIDLRFGVYLPAEKAEPLAQMLQKAFSAVTAGAAGSCCGFYVEDGGEQPARKWELVNQMERAFFTGDFILFLQPKVRLSDSQIVGADASLRWRSPQSGLLTPEMFLPILEEYQMAAKADIHLFELVCRQLEAWMRAGWTPCPLSMPLSRETISSAGFMARFVKIGRQYGVIPELIEFRLDASADDLPPELAAEAVEEIHAASYRCALDRFGAVSVPLHLLRALNVDTVKLDRNLFTGENNNRKNRFVVEAVLKIAAQMQIQTVADGIDNASQIQYLEQAGCDTVQGICFFPPMTSEEFRNTAYEKGTLRTVRSDTARASKDTPASGGPAAGNLIMFTLRLSRDSVQFSHLFSPVLEGQFRISGAQALFRHSALIHENDRKDFFHLVDRCQKEAGWVENVVRFYTAKGRYEWLEVHLHKEEGNAVDEPVIFGTLVNTASWKNEVDRWKEKATRDALTGLYNREFYEQYAGSAVEKGMLTSAAVVFIDIDDFKLVNDTLGHVIGDDVICFVAKRILSAFRHTDIVARYGGDEFVVFVNGIGRGDLTKRLQQLCDGFRFPYRNGSIEYPVSGSIGAALYPENGTTYLELLEHADCALYEAKERGKNRFMVYEPGMENGTD